MTYIQSFEDTAAELAIEQGYRYVICGHIHQPQMREVSSPKGRCTYLNSGDWIENLSALEFDGHTWQLYQHQAELMIEEETDEEELNDLDLNRIIQKVTFNEGELAS